MSKAIAHIVGMAVVVQGHLCRQRCAWCGVVLVDVDLEDVAVAEGSGAYNPFWEINAVLEVEASDDGTVVRSSIVLGPLAGVLPDNACTPPRPRTLKLVPP